MLNHVESLLLNENPVDANGVVPGFLVDSAYSKRVFTPVLASLSSRMKGSGDMESKIERVLRVCSYMRRCDLSEYWELFDVRATNKPLSDSADDDPTDVLDSAPVSLLFARTGNKRMDEALSELKELASSSRDAGVRKAARAFAFVVQLDAAGV